MGLISSMYNNTPGRSSGSHSSFNKPISRGPSFGSRGSYNPRFSGAPSRGRFPARRIAPRIDVSRYINKSAVPVAPTAPYVPEHAFDDFAITEKLKANIITKGYTTPTPIQDKSIPVVLAGSDIVGIANTGTGKTAAFLIPLINKVLLNPRELVLIVVPTRELAMQIDEELKGFTKGLGLHSVVCVGGASITMQLRALRLFNNFVIGTPGRIKDLIDRRALNLAGFKTAVLDEADRMLDMGFVNDMRRMMGQMPKEKQTLFFSATMSPEVEGLIKEFLRNPVRISTKTGTTAKNVEQDVVRVAPGRDKLDTLHDLLKGPGYERVLIFGRTKHGVERLSRTLVERGFLSASIHGNKSQPQRERALADFKNNRAKILVATDVAARGLDINDITHVINYDLPATHDDYIHRIGRTGRGNKKGKALTFVE